MKKNECPSVSHDCAACESVRKYFTRCRWKPFSARNHQNTMVQIVSTHMDFQNLENDNTLPKNWWLQATYQILIVAHIYIYIYNCIQAYIWIYICIYSYVCAPFGQHSGKNFVGFPQRRNRGEVTQLYVDLPACGADSLWFAMNFHDFPLEK